MKKGNIICFEGIDGAGKRTQAALLMKKLRASGVRSKVYSYPDYASEYGKIIDGYLHGKMKLGRTEHFLLFLIDIMKDGESLKKDLQKGNDIIMDRYFYTALAYICPSGLDYKRARGFIELMDFVRPSIVFYLDMPSELTSSRKKKQKGSLDKFEKNQKFLKDVKKVYERMFTERYACNKWIRIDASRPITEVHNDIIRILGKNHY